MNLITLVGGLIATVGALAWIGIKFLRFKLRTPPASWQDVVEFSKRNGAPLPAAIKGSQVRRQLILASARPALFSNAAELKAASVDLAKLGKPTDKRIIGFFHPNANAGGGGERVLWVAVKQALASPTNIVALYVGAGKLTPAMLIENAKDRFGVTFTQEEADRIVVIFLSQRRLIEAATYPLLTLLGQSIGMMLLGYEAIGNLMPDVFVDTMGLPFSYPIVSVFGRIPIAAYVHYPFVQQDMLKSIRFWSPKQLYWRLMLLAYRFAGSFANEIVANSTWTAEHLKANWPRSQISVVFPPVAVQDFAAVTGDEQRTPALVYVAQFRPEKRHELVIKAFAKVVNGGRKVTNGKKPHLILIGSVRNLDDKQRVAGLRELATSLNLTDSDYTIVENAPWTAVRQILSSSLIGLNAMWNEHFGMGVVEIMAAGLIPVVHASAGPLLDIVKDSDTANPPGFFFRSHSDPDYAAAVAKGEKYPVLSEAMIQALQLSSAQQHALSKRAHAAAQRFGDASFTEAWGKHLDEVLASEPKLHKQRLSSGLFD